MNRLFLIRALACLVLFPAVSGAEDMRQAFQDMERNRRAMAAKADQALARAKEAAREKALAIRADKQALTRAIAELKAGNKALKQENKGLEKRIQTLRTHGDDLRDALAESRAVNKELAGFVRAYAKDLDSLLSQSLQSALIPDRDTFLSPVINRERFWSMDDLRRMAGVAIDEILASGRVELRQGPIIDRQGKDRTATILTLGNFTGIYVLDKGDGAVRETGFLIYSDQSQRFFALSKLPSAALADQLQA